MDVWMPDATNPVEDEHLSNVVVSQGPVFLRQNASKVTEPSLPPFIEKPG